MHCSPVAVVLVADSEEYILRVKGIPVSVGNATIYDCFA